MIKLALALTLATTIAARDAAEAQAVPADASAADSQRVRDLVIASEQASDAGDYDKTIGLLEDAYAIVPHPVLLYNLGQAHHLAAHYQLAADYYHRFLATNPTGLEATLAERWLAELAAIAEITSAPTLAAADAADPFDAALDRRMKRRTEVGNRFALAGSAAIIAGIGLAVTTEDGGVRKVGILLAIGGVPCLGGGLAVASRARTARANARHRVIVVPTLTTRYAGLAVSGPLPW